MVDLRVDPFPSEVALADLFSRAWSKPDRPFGPILERSLAHVGAFDGERLVGFVNVAWDGGAHAFILDTCVDPDYRRRGIGLELVRAARDTARLRGASWLHVDFEPHLADFYRACGFIDSAAGVQRLG